MKKILLCSVALVISGCVMLPPDPTDIEKSNADYGKKPSAEFYEGNIKSFQETRLKDPMSALYSFSEPKEMWCKIDGKVRYGWVVDYMINAKNSYGGYVGAKPQFSLINNDEVLNPEWYSRASCRDK